MIRKSKEVVSKLELGVLELLLGLFIFIGVIGYFVDIPADLEWLDHSISFVLFTYLFYKLDITNILFGKTIKRINFAIVISFFALFFINIIAFTEELAFRYVFLKFLDNFNYILLNKFSLDLINLGSFYAGIIGLLLITIYLVLKIKVQKPSLIYAVTKNFARNKTLSKFIVIFISLLGFFYFIYNPILEWLEFTLDDPIVIVGLIYFISRVVKHKQKFETHNFVFKIGDISEKLYKKFISLFHYKKTLPLAVSGLIVLHALTDLAAFAITFIVGTKTFFIERLFRSSTLLGGQEAFLRQFADHRSFIHLFTTDINLLPSGGDEIFSFMLLIVYAFNALSLVGFLVIPIVAWSKLFLNKAIHLSRFYLPLLYSSITAYILLPAYTIGTIDSNFLVGVDIKTNSIFNTGSILAFFIQDRELLVFLVALISILVGVAVSFLARKDTIRKEMFSILILGGFAFYASYIYSFFKSTAGYLFGEIANFIIGPHILIAIILTIILIMSFFFYVGGYITLVYEIVMEYHKKKWSDPIDDEVVKLLNKVKIK